MSQEINYTAIKVEQSGAKWLINVSWQLLKEIQDVLR